VAVVPICKIGFDGVRVHGQTQIGVRRRLLKEYEDQQDKLCD